MTQQNSLQTIASQQQRNSNKTCKMITNTVQMVTTKQYIILLVHVQISVDIMSVQFDFQYCKFCHIGSRYFADPIYRCTSRLISFASIIFLEAVNLSRDIIQ